MNEKIDSNCDKMFYQIDKLKQDVQMNIEKNQEIFDDIFLKSSQAIQQANQKLHKIEDSDKIRSWVTEQIGRFWNMRKSDMDSQFMQLEFKFNTFYKDLNEIPNLVGNYERYDNARDYMIKMYDESKTRVRAVEIKLEKQVTSLEEALTKLQTSYQYHSQYYSQHEAANDKRQEKSEQTLKIV